MIWTIIILCIAACIFKGISTHSKIRARLANYILATKFIRSKKVKDIKKLLDMLIANKYINRMMITGYNQKIYLFFSIYQENYLKLLKTVQDMPDIFIRHDISFFSTNYTDLYEQFKDIDSKDIPEEFFMFGPKYYDWADYSSIMVRKVKKIAEILSMK